jgi:D-alanyl-lipoteichoic acid acyltransferase DltB (MBOAT superfamily)
MNSILAWFVTFNFVNIAWVFFRAKEWEDAIKVLKGMFGFSGVTLPERLEKYCIGLSQYNIQFSGQYLLNIQGNILTLIFIIIIIIFVVSFENSAQKSKSYESNYKNLFLTALFLTISIMSLSKDSEFLYFNF